MNVLKIDPSDAATSWGMAQEDVAPMQNKYYQRFFTEEERFWQKVEKTDSCWLWAAFVDRDGYGLFRLGAPSFRNIRAHHYLMPSVPKGMQVDHLCRTRNCVRPEHLEIVTCRENLYRSAITAASIRSQQTECIHGHSLADAFVDKFGNRHCSPCRNYGACVDCGARTWKKAPRCRSCGQRERHRKVRTVLGGGVPQLVKEQEE